MKSDCVVTQISSNWNLMKAIIKKRWAELSDEDINKIKGRKDRLVATLIDKFEISPEEAEDEVDIFWH
jgi:uncharacterized protein YjbJ (UPF0337 family)